MLRASPLVFVFALAGCTFAQKHPAVTVGIVAGTVGFTTCFLAVEKPGTCGLVGAGAGVAIGGVTGLATTIFEADAPAEPDDSDAEMMRRLRGDGIPEGPYLPPEPNPLPQTALPDAGVAPPSDAGAPGAAPADAGTGDASSAGSPAAPAAPAGSASGGTPASP